MLAACAAPLVKPNFTPNAQYKVGHAADWQALARRSVAALPGGTITEKPKVFIAPGPADMPFAAAYRSYLEEALSERDFQVVSSAPGAVVLNFDVATYLYGSATGNQKQLIDYASFWTTLGGVASQLRHISSVDTGVFAGVVAGPVIDVLASMTATTRAEVVVTTRVVDAERTHYLKSEAFYVQPTDLPFYWTAMPTGAPQVMTADAGGLALVSMPVVRGSR